MPKNKSFDESYFFSESECADWLSTSLDKSLRDTFWDPRFAGFGVSGPGFQPMKDKIRKVAGKWSSFLLYIVWNFKENQ